jgi:hypothetical protein
VKPKRHTRLCRYCRLPVSPTLLPSKDHVIPRWVLRAYPERFDVHRNNVTACRPCNSAKGSVPAAIFVRVRLDPVALGVENRRWDRICQQVRDGAKEEHRELVYAEYGRPIPEHFVPGTRAIEVRPGNRVAHGRLFQD